MSVAQAIDAESVPMLWVMRVGDSYDSNGNAVPGSVSKTNIRAALQPVSGSQLLDLPEGVRSSASNVIWSRFTLQNGNTVEYAGETYRVVHIWPRRSDGFTKAAVSRVKS